jgi:hypothetical protein
MKISRRSWVVICCCAVFTNSSFVAFGKAPELPIFSDGSARVYWDVSETLRKQMFGSLPIDPVTDFTRVFSMMTGSEIGPKREGGIPLRLELLAPKAPTSPLAHLPEGFRETASEIAVTPESVTIRAESPSGLSGGLYKILEDWGCHWVMDGELGEVIPSHESLTLPMGTQLVTIGVDTGFGARRGVTIQRNRLLPATWLPGMHFWRYGVEPEKYFKTHPEYFPLVDGVRKTTQVETVNPDVIRLKIEHAKEYFQKLHPTARSYPMDPEDNMEFSEAPEATRLDPPGTGPDGLPLMSDRVVLFANAVLEGFQSDFPDKTVAFYSYLNHSQPPVNVRLNPKAAVGVTRFGFCNLRLTPTATTPSPQQFEDLVKAWLDQTKNVYIYEYNPPTWAAALPFPNYLEIGESMRRLHRIGAKGFYSDGHGIASAPGVFLNEYIAWRMMVNPEQDPKTLMDDYCRFFFGPASETMVAYYDTLAEITKFHDPARPAVGVSIYRFEELFPRNIVKRASAQLDEALKTPGLSDIERRRLEWVKLGNDYLVSYLAAIDAAKAGNYEAAKKAFDNTRKMISLQERAGHPSLKMADARVRIQAVESTILATYFPQKRGMVTRWSLLGPIPRADFPLPVEEEILARGTALKDVTVGQQSYRWISHTSHEGLLNLNAALDRSGLDVPLSKMFASATITAPDQLNVQASFSSFYPFKVFLNGKMVFERDAFNFDFPDANTKSLELSRGVNEFVILCDERSRSTRENTQNDGFDWSVSLRLLDANGQPLNLPGMHVSP